MRNQNSSTLLKQWEEYQRRLAAEEPIPCGAYPLPSMSRREDEMYELVRN